MMKPISTAVLSYGMSGKVFHAPLLTAHPGFTLQKIVQRHARDTTDKYPEIEIVNSVENIFGDDKIELVVVNTVNETHFEFTKKALESGKHVVVEKPFTITVKEGQKLIEIARKSNRILSVFQNRRWDSDFLTIRKTLDQKLIGRIAEYEANFDRFRNYIQPDTWKETPGPGSGLLYNLGPHLIDQALVLLGKPEGVYADIRKIRDQSQVDDCFEILLYYNKVKVRLHSSYLVRTPNPRFVLHGTLGSFVKFGLDPQEEDLKKGGIPGSPGWGEEDPAIYGTLETEARGKYRKEIIRSEAGNYLEFYNGIYESIRNGKVLPVTAEEALMNIRVIELAYQSSLKKKMMACSDR